MLQKLSVCKVVDNSGAEEVRCFGVYRKKKAALGDTIIVSVTKLRSFGRRLFRGEVQKAVVLCTCYPVFRSRSGVGFASDYNKVALLRRTDLSPVGSRVRGSLPLDLRRYGLGRFLLVCQGIF